MGYALFLAQMGERHSPMAKALGGFGGATVIEVRESHDGNAYRAVYTVRYADAVYVLHAFQKKSKKGSATPRAEIELIEKRLEELTKEKTGPQRTNDLRPRIRCETCGCSSESPTPRSIF